MESKLKILRPIIIPLLAFFGCIYIVIDYIF